MSNATELDSILDAPPAQEAPATAPTEPAQQGVKDQSTAPPAPTPQSVEPEHVPRAALMDERRKRQELEKQFVELQRAIQAQQPQPQAPDLYADPEHYAATLRSHVEQANFATRVEVTELVMSEKHPDYAEKRDLFIATAEQDPALIMKMMKSANPAKFAYDMGRKIAVEREVGNDPAAYREKVRAELMQELGINPSAPAAPKSLSAPVPKSLASIPSAPARAPNGQFRSNGPTPLSDIIG